MQRVNQSTTLCSHLFSFLESKKISLSLVCATPKMAAVLSSSTCLAGLSSFLFRLCKSNSQVGTKVVSAQMILPLLSVVLVTNTVAFEVGGGSCSLPLPPLFILSVLVLLLLLLLLLVLLPCASPPQQMEQGDRSWQSRNTTFSCALQQPSCLWYFPLLSVTELGDK